MRNIQASIVLVVVALMPPLFLVVGCKSKPSMNSVKGAWVGKYQIEEGRVKHYERIMRWTSDQIAKYEASLEEWKLGEYPLELREDGSYVMVFPSAPIEGKWTFEFDRVVCTIEKLGGVSIQELIAKYPGTYTDDPFELRVAEDSSHLMLVANERKLEFPMQYSRKED